jgi:lipoprotein-releasing system permease protein
VRDWRDVNENLFEAMRLEKVVIFFVIFVIVIAAAFNVASSLYINVVRSYPEIGILKALGVSQGQLARIFSIQGVLLGFVGCVAGLLGGLALCIGFTILENQFGILPGSVYKLDRIDVQFRAIDLISIFSATMLICFLATWAPARRAAKLTAVEGLRHE